jgi:hypothetical protein
MAVAAIFPDVSDTYIYRPQIENLVGKKVINGHDDGTFRPEEKLNRAAALTMLFRAAGITPPVTDSVCFPDVLHRSWYENTVCHAARQHFVEGYSDGLFRPDNKVTRAEMAKMSLTVLGISVPEITEIDRSILKYVDLSTSAWYTKWLSAAFQKKMLPIPGFATGLFEPNKELTRGQAAAYIYNALAVKESEAVPEPKPEEEIEEVSSSSSVPRPTTKIFNVNFPFTDSGTFEEVMKVAYQFSLSTKTVADISVTLPQNVKEHVRCRIYKLETDGISNEYYIGYTEPGRCMLLVSIPAGNYQLLIEPVIPDLTYSVNAKKGTGDGLDGFSQAKALEKGNLRVDVLDGADLQDWFTFTVKEETDLTVDVISNSALDCIIHSTADVFGDIGPKCDEVSHYTPGVYYVGVLRTTARGAKQTYSITIK